MLSTTRPRVQITLSRQEIERWPDTAAARSLADACPHEGPASFRVPALARAVPVCRHLVGLWMDSKDVTDEGVRYMVSLVMSELMTNAIVHTNSRWITGRLRRTGDLILMDVHEEGATSSDLPSPRASHADESGRGLVLVAQSVQALGTRLETDGSRTVWARIGATR